jgi:hypothetical protein
LVFVDLQVADWSDVVPRMAQAWPVVAGAVERFVRDAPSWEWDRLRAYVRFDSGIIWVSPDPERPRRNANAAGIKLACLELMYHELPDAVGDPDGFERSHEVMSRRVVEALRASALLPAARASLAALQRLRPQEAALTCVEYDDLETEQVVVTLAEPAGTT